MTFAFDPVLPACAAALFASLFCVTAAGQEPAADPGRALLARLDAQRVPAAKVAATTLAIEGTYTVTFAGMGNGEPVAKGTFQEAFAGADLARHTSDMGPLGKMERGIRGDLVWEVDPGMGAKVHRGVHDAAVRRYYAWLRGAPLSPLYTKATKTGSETVGERECEVWRLEPAAGPADVVRMAADGTVLRLDIALPVPESADATWELQDAMPATVTFADWTEIDGVRLPRQRTMQMGPATVAFACTKLQFGATFAREAFEPPPAVAKAKAAPAAEPAFGPDGKPNYQVVPRDAQPAVTIRVKCKPDEIGKTLGTILPEVMAHLTEVGGKVAGPPFSVYHCKPGDAEVDLEGGIPVQAPVAEKGRVKNMALPAGRTLTAWHVGPYEGLAAAHEGLQQHVAAKGYKVRGPVWEVYWTDPGMVPDPAKWRTQLFQPIE
ncbi:MAG: GyrI-like domain-containing protein [Planctomycetes bacterium]|nr:GyrI-like domain-containing protein [Planctomycetota bacterium]